MAETIGELRRLLTVGIWKALREVQAQDEEMVQRGEPRWHLPADVQAMRHYADTVEFEMGGHQWVIKVTKRR